MDRCLYARKVIRADTIAAAAAVDRALTARMKAGGLTLKQCEKAWARIRAARWRRVLDAEMALLALDLQARYATHIAAHLHQPSTLGRIFTSHTDYPKLVSLTSSRPRFTE